MTRRRELRSLRSTQKRGSPLFLLTRTTLLPHWLVLLRMTPCFSISSMALSAMACAAGPRREGAWQNGVASGLRSMLTSVM